MYTVVFFKLLFQKSMNLISEFAFVIEAGESSSTIE